MTRLDSLLATTMAMKSMLGMSDYSFQSPEMFMSDEEFTEYLDELQTSCDNSN